MKSTSLSIRPLMLPSVLRVAGTSHHPASRAVSPGDELVVQAEKDNPFDADACVVLRDGEIVGRVPRQITGRLRATGAESWPAEVVEVFASEHPGLRIKVLPGVPAMLSVLDKSATADVAVAPPVSGLAPAVEVRSRSGRRLGVLASPETSAYAPDTVSVQTDEGTLVRYPSSLVELCAEQSTR